MTDFFDILDKFPTDLRDRVLNLSNCDQRRDKHPEGDVLTHTMVVFSRLQDLNDMGMLLSAIFHDIGKDVTASTHPKKGHITHFGHEKVSAQLVLDNADLIASFGCDVNRVHCIVKNHMRIKFMDDMKPSKQQAMRDMAFFNDLVTFNKADKGGF